MLERQYPRDHPALLRPLQILASTRCDQGNIGKARETIRRMQSIRCERAEDRAMLHAMTAPLLHAGGRRAEAEAEYLAALDAWEQAGRAESADAAGVLNILAALYIEEARFPEARRSLDRA